MELTEKKGDLFSCSEQESLAHCVSQDLHMGKGIAVLFKKKFGGVSELKAQGQDVGGVAVLKAGIYIYYLITKLKYFHKPTYATLQASLTAMREHCVANGVRYVSMPKIGCGLDGLQWSQVSQTIKDVFTDTNITVTIYTL